MKLLVTGAQGMLGSDICLLSRGRYETWGIDILPAEETDVHSMVCDITDSVKVRTVVASVKPDVIVHCAGVTDVDWCEGQEAQTYAVNVEATRVLADAARECGALFCYISTDYVFDGTKECPYVEDDPCHPCNTYGRSKMDGERAALASDARVLVIRTSGLFGGQLHHHNFVSAIIDRSRNNAPITVVNDQQGRPTYTRDFARGLFSLIEYYHGGETCAEIFHIANRGETTWFNCARTIVEKIGNDSNQIKPITSEELGRHAARPKRWTLSTGKYERLFNTVLRPWADALDDYLKHVIPVTMP